VRLDRKRALNHLPNGVELRCRNNSRTPAVTHNLQHAGCCQNLELALYPASHKHIAGKEREPDFLGPVIPATNRAIKGKINFVALTGEGLGDRFLMLMARK